MVGGLARWWVVGGLAGWWLGGRLGGSAGGLARWWVLRGVRRLIGGRLTPNLLKKCKSYTHRVQLIQDVKIFHTFAHVLTQYQFFLPLNSILLMAKSKSFFGLRSGSTKSHTYQILHGEQVTKDRVYRVANPKTRAQMSQRALFANAVKFYKHSLRAFFKFAFEDKKQNESEYNAFMRHNVSASLILNKSAVESKNFPAIGAEWMLTQGQLPNIDTRFLTDIVEGTSVEWPVVVFEGESEVATTLGGLSALFINAYGLQGGDIITLVHVDSRAENIYDEDPINAPQWRISQFKLNTTSETLITEVLGSNAKVVNHEGVGLCLEFGYVPDPMYAGAATCVVSRVTPAGTLVSDSYLKNNSIAGYMVEASKEQSYVDGALNSWGSTGEAILQGALAYEEHTSPAPVFTGFQGMDVTLGDVSRMTVTAIGEHLNSDAIEGQENLVIVQGSDLNNVDPSKISVTTSMGTMTFAGVATDAQYGMYWRFNVGTDVSQARVFYDGTELFIVF